MKRINLALFILFFAVIAFSTLIRFSYRGHALPIGCDEFGFLHMAEAISQGKLFDQHTRRPFESELIQHMENAGFKYREYAWAIAPHAYHVDPVNKKIINQYPPGTSALMSILPKSERQDYFGMMMMVLMLMIPALIIYQLRFEMNSTGMALTLTAAISTFAILSEPMLTEFGRINSVAPTYGLLLASGIAFERRPYISIWLLGMSCIFRIANILLLPPLVIYLVFQDQAILKHLGSLISKGLKIGLVLLLSGIGLYFLYVFLLLGNPLLPTYSEIDQRSIGMDVVVENLSYYVLDNLGWLFMNLAAVAGLVVFYRLNKISRRLMLTLISIPVLVYVYFLFHYIKTPYYPYAPSLFIAGFLIWQWSNLTIAERKTSMLNLSVCTGIALAIGIRSALAYDEKKAVDDRAEILNYSTGFQNVDVLWGDLRSSTFEYATGKPGMRLTWGSEKAAIEIIHWLDDHGMSQAFMLDDFPLETREKLEQILADRYSIRKTRNHVFGNVIFIDK